MQVIPAFSNTQKRYSLRSTFVLMKLLNIGCGSVFHPAWINLDINPPLAEVQACDIRRSLPYADRSIDACYSSHVLEHLTQSEAKRLVAECFRVLKPLGVIRIVVPDLEAIVRYYLSALEQAESGVAAAEPDYDWMMLELYDQTVRSYSGGAMADYLRNPAIQNKAFIRSRIGSGAEAFWQSPTDAGLQSVTKWVSAQKLPNLIQKLKHRVAAKWVGLLIGSEAQQALQEGLFRHSGEIHRWMYDRFSLRRLLQQAGFMEVQVCQATESRIPHFNDYGLDVDQGRVRKPDSLFMEGIKP